ncbi:MAG: topoisomerase DNA-binding C4 zinc finger domain-containing protein [Nanoarchaeota archaeon]|nr:topoisomerase DNA-binding C4 zinc finger domain-containing protein [Nanoarchaeota archaeon]
MYELIISEKPQAAAKIATALADKAPAKHREFNVNYFALTHKGKQIRVASAVGHLYILGEKGGESWKYPVFDTEWKPIYKVNKAAKYTADYIKLLTKLGNEANEVTVASDYDIEGEVIGLNVVRYACGKKDANRMKFSTLTKGDLVKAYENKQNHLEWGQANAGETRHTLDWYYGINLSRAFTQAIKKGTNQFKVLSTGRVQAPALHFLAERERKILAFVPEEFSEIYLKGNCSSVKIKAQYELPDDKVKERKAQLEEESDDEDEKFSVDKSKIFDNDWANQVVSETTGKNGKISEISAKRFKQKVPTPFDLTSLQMEASTMLGLSPKRTLELAQKLYIEGVTSYPRTSSQKLPAELNLKDVLKKLEKFPNYRDKVSIVYSVNPSLKPNEGKKTDPAHPAIHPTGELPKKLESQEQRLYDLIVKRFLAVFGKDAVRETNLIKIDIEGHYFILKGTRTVEKNWHELYEPYLKFEEVELPKLEKGLDVINKKIEKLDKKTLPPKRYTDASIIKELEKRNLGTKATRAEILANLSSRGFIVDKSIKVTELGLKMDEILTSDVPDLVDEKLTRKFEEEMEKIRQNKYKPEKTLKEAINKLNIILKEVSDNEVDLGKRLADASHIARVEIAKVGKCPNCEKGVLMIRAAKKTGKKFVGCDNYPDCKTIFNLPMVPVVKPIPNQPDEEGKIYVFAGKSDGNMQKVCINETVDVGADGVSGEKKYDEEGMDCPNCKEGKMRLRKSFYGEFLGCDNYPKCKTMMKVVSGKVDVSNPISPVVKKKTPAKKKVADKKIDSGKKDSVKKTSVKKKED